MLGSASILSKRLVLNAASFLWMRVGEMESVMFRSNPFATTDKARREDFFFRHGQAAGDGFERG